MPLLPWSFLLKMEYSLRWSSMVLNYKNGLVSILNKELMEKFNDALMKESTLGYLLNLRGC